MVNNRHVFIFKMAPACLSRGRDSDSGSESGSESEGIESSASVSSSDESVKNKRNHSNHGSERSKSRSPSPVNSQGTGSSHSEGRKSRRDSGSSISMERRSELVHSPDRRTGEEQDENNDAKSVRSNMSGSRSPSPDSLFEGDNLKKNSRSRSASEGSNVSRQSSVRSRSASVESESDKKSGKHSHSPLSNHSEPKQNEAPSSRENSRPGSRSSQRSRSSSKNRSDSDVNSNRGSPRKSISPELKSRSNSPGKSRSPSPESDIEADKSRQSLGSKSPESMHNDDKDDDDDDDPEAKQSITNDKRDESQSAESDSESEVNDDSKKRKRAVVSDESGSDTERRKKIVRDEDKEEEESVDKELVIDAEALFGNASDISSEDEAGKKRDKCGEMSDEKADVDGEVEDEIDRDKIAERANETDDPERDEDKENEADDQQLETRIDVEVPKITMNLGKELHFIKLPNFLSVETRPFDRTNYEDEIDEEETLDEEGRARLKLKVENTIRWREVANKNGELVKQSNARFVRWSDGSMSLHLGSEIFDVYKQSLHGDHNHLFIRQGTGLQGQAVFRTKLTFRPHSTESFTHRKMTMSLADRSQKTTGIKVLSLVGKDPEAHRGELIKKEEERLRASVRRASKQKRIREKAANRGLSVSYLEPDRYNDVDSDDEVISINAIKKQHQNKLANRKGDRPHIYSSDEEGSDIETRRARRLDKAKALKDSDSEEGSGGGGGGIGVGGGGSQPRGRSSSREE